MAKATKGKTGNRDTRAKGASKPRPKKRATKREAPQGALPDKAEILDFVQRYPDQATKRDIARAFNIKGSARIPLKRMLREMADEGLISKSPGKRLLPPGELPPVAVIDLVARDADGEILARPANWTSETEPPMIVLAPDKKVRGLAAAGIGDRVLAKLRQVEGDYPYEARIIKKLGEGGRSVLGVFEQHERGGGYLKPVDKKARGDLLVEPGDEAGAQPGELVLAETLSGPRYGPRRARVKERLGSMSEPRSISLIAIHEHGIPTDFPPEVVEQAESAAPARIGKRTDLRELPFVTIDPADARDHDDAVWAAPDDDPANKDGWVIMVAIADVAHYVTPGSPMDREARKRGNSTYFPDRVVPMLPERISNDLCSLIDGVQRPSLVVRMVFDKKGNKRSHEFLRAMIRSVASLSYRQAQDAFDGNPDETAAPLKEAVLDPLWKAYHALVESREERQPLALDLPEHRIRLDEEGHVASIAVAERFEAHRLIEELMIAANVCAAETLEKEGIPLVYRVHDAPALEKLHALREFLQSLDISLIQGTIKPHHLNRILDRVRNTPHAEMVNDVVLRSQSQACYDPNNLGHFGLNLRRYAHFTSPIRRYADLIVHRALIRACQLGAGGLSDEEVANLSDTAEHISNCERRSMAAERDSVDRYVAAYLSEHVGATFAGRITSVTRFGLFISLNDTGADGLVPIRTLSDEFFDLDETAHTLTGSRSGIVYRLGDPVEVRLVEAAPVTGGLRFELLEGGTMRPRAKGAKGTRGARGSKAKGRKTPSRRKGNKPSKRGTKPKSRQR